MGSHSTITSTTTAHAQKLEDGRIYEDELSGQLTKSQVTNTNYIKNKIASIIQSGGVDFDADAIGSTQMDFTYIAYGVSQSNTDQTSAYIYAGRYNKSNVLGNVAIEFDKLTIAGVAEITDVVANELDTGFFISSKHDNLS